MNPVIRLDGVTRRFGSGDDSVVAVDDVSLELLGGQVVGLAGPSGSGKTTLLRLVVGWEVADSGTVVRATDRSGRGSGAADWTGLSMVPQDLGVLAELTVRQNVALPLRIARLPLNGVDEVLDELGLADLVRRLPAQLSLGEQQRVAVARAVVPGPALLVADEPTAHQDQRNADRVMQLLAGLAVAGGAVVVATHDDRLLDRVDRVIHMVDGRLVTV